MSVLVVALLAGWAGIALLDGVLFVVNAGEVVFRSASQAMTPSVVERADLERANGWLAGGTTVMQGMIAGPFGGFLFVLAAALPFVVNAGTYAVSAVLVGLVAGTYRASSRVSAAAERRSVRAELAEGFRWLVRQRMLRTMAILIGLLNVTLTATTAVLVLLARERLHLGAVGYGALFTCEAVGALLGSAAGDWLIKRVTARCGPSWAARCGSG
jgi:Na+/melibiose symporter-like transporter